MLLSTRFFWWIYNPMGSLKKLYLVVLWTTLGNSVNMQINTVITETYIFFNILATMHYIISNMVSTHMFSWSKMLSYEYAYMCMQIRTAIIEKSNFFNIWKTMHDNIMKLVSTHMFAWSLPCSIYLHRYSFHSPTNNLMRLVLLKELHRICIHCCMLCPPARHLY